MSTEPIISEQDVIPSKSMKGKYDGRVKANKTRIVKPTGRKPLFAKHLTRNTAAVVLKESSAKELWMQLLETKDARLQFEVLRYLTDRLEGKPFVAVNPAEQKNASPILEDKRIQVAIQNLILPAAKQKRIKGESEQPAKLLEAENPKSLR